MKYILNEAKLSRNLAAPFIKAFKEIGLTESEANYFMNLYGELRQRNLLDSNMFKPKRKSEVDADSASGSFVLDYDGKLPDIKQLQVLAKDPEALMDVFNYVINNEHFLNSYEIEVLEDDVKLKKAKAKKQITGVGEKAAYREVAIVIEDKNWVTYNPKTANQAIMLKENYFSTNVTDEERRIITNNPEKFGFSDLYYAWCIGSGRTTNSHFQGQKNKKGTDEWYVTFTKKRPIDIYREAVEGRGRFNLDHFRQTYGDEHMGEIYLRDTTRPTTVGRNKYGYYPWRNAYTGVGASVLTNGPSYDYETLKFKSNEPLLIDGTTLMKVNLNEKEIVIPAGVREIEEGAFSNLDKVETIILPITTLVIHSGAIKKLPNLRKIKVSNNFVALEEGAIDNIIQLANRNMGGVVMVGVFDDKEETLKKPARLQYMQSNLLKEYKALGGGI